MGDRSEYQKEYREKNKQALAEKHARYREANAEAIRARKKAAWAKVRDVANKKRKERWREFRVNDPEAYQTLLLKRKYGITEADYKAMFAAQSGYCAICRKEQRLQRKGRGYVTKRLHVDHDHATGKVRALLCDACNTMLGLARDDADLLRKAADYIDRHSLVGCGWDA